MPRTVSITRGITIASSGTTVLQIPSTPKQTTQTTDRHILLTKSVGTTVESVDPSALDIGTNGYCYLSNLGPTNFVEWGTTSGDYVGKIKAGDHAGPFQLNAGKTLYLKADTAACDVQILILAD